MSYEFILYETDERLAFITLNRPEKLNPLSHDLRGELFHAMKEAEADTAIGVIVLRGAGRAFSAGYDLAPSGPTGSPYVHPRSNMPDTGSTHPGHYDWSRHAVMANWMIWELAKPASRRSTATASRAAPSWLPSAISASSRRTRRSGTRRCGRWGRWT